LVDYDDPAIPGKARARAAKWMSQLFIPQHFSAIMKSVDPNPNISAFTTACVNAGLTSEEIDWLWAYLKNCRFAVYDAIPEAAASGW
jgi:hypothetical protein